MDYGGFIHQSYSNSFYFTNASNNDMLIYPETSNQSFHIGITSNSTSLLTVNSNTLTLNASLVVKGPITTNNNLTYAPVDYGVSNFSILGAIVGSVAASASNPFSLPTEGSLYLNGTNNITLSNSIFATAIKPGFTVEAWINVLGSPSSGDIYFIAPYVNPWVLGITQTLNIKCGFWDYQAIPAFRAITSTNVMQINTWYHVAMTHDTTTCRLFLNGVLQGSTTAALGTSIGTSPLYITYSPGMYITNPRIVYGSALYTANFTPPSAPLTISPTGTTALLLRVPQNPGRVLIPKIGGTTQSQVYPPAAMTGYLTNIKNTSYGAGNYIASGSSEANIGHLSYYPFDYSGGSRWTVYGYQASAANSSYTGQTSTIDINGNIYMGEWVQLCLPISNNVSSVYLNPFMANLIYLLGSVDGINWYLITKQYLSGAPLTFTTSVVYAFNYFRVIINSATNTNGNGTAGFFDILFYGTQESISITTDGQVGLDVTQPVQQLEVTGNAIINGNISANNLGMFRDRIINGSMQVNQRGVTSSNYTGTISRSVYDRYYLENLNVNTNSIINITQNTLTSSDTPYQLGFNNSLKITINGVDSGASSRWFGGLCQNIEGYNISDFSLGTVYSSPFTVSGWFRSSMSTGSTVTLSTRTFSGATSYSYLTNTIVTGSNNWQYLKMTVPPLVISGSIITSSNNALQLFIAPSAADGTNTTNSWIGNATYTSPTTTNWANTVGNWVEITGVQLEKGTMATPFEFRPYSRELKLCQRYYWQQVNTFYVSALDTTNGDPRVWMNHPVPMRAVPTITGTSLHTFSATNITTMGFSCGDWASGAGAFGTINSIYANAEIE